jgi:AcrR family transcriptional regulator
VSASRKEQIVAEARVVLEEEGPAGLTMRRLADRLGIRAPSLYKHVADKELLEIELITLGFEEFAATMAAAVAEAAEPLPALAAKYRLYALAHPHLYRLMTERPLPRDRLPTGLEERAAAPVVAAAGDEHRARALWAFAHGMVQLELAGRFPPAADLDAAWREGVAAFAARTPSRRTIVRSVRGPD